MTHECHTRNLVFWLYILYKVYLIAGHGNLISGQNMACGLFL